VSSPMPTPPTWMQSFSGLRLIDGHTVEPPLGVRAFFRESVPGAEDVNELVTVEFHDAGDRLHVVPAHAVLYLFEHHAP
jgi:hypothetical protein